MRVMVMIRSTEEMEKGALPTQQLIDEMGAFNEELVKAGVLLAGEGLLPSSTGVRVEFTGKTDRTVIDGPFAETKELIAGFWIWQVRSMDEAIEWVRRCPNPDGAGGVVEIRRIAEADDFGDAFTPEAREREARLRAQATAQRH